MTISDQSADPPRPFADVLQTALPLVPPEGETLNIFLNRLNGRAHGVLALVLGVLLLIPVKWVLPQLAGVVLVASGWRLFGGADAPALPFLGGRMVAKARLEAITSALRGQKWLHAISQPRLADFAAGFGVQAAAVALIVAGLAALVPSTHYLLGVGLVLLGLGLMQRDGAAALTGIALSFGAAAFTLTLVAGTAAGAPFAAGWGQENLPFLSPSPPQPLLPDDHATR